MAYKSTPTVSRLKDGSIKDEPIGTHNVTRSDGKAQNVNFKQKLDLKN